MFQSKLPAEIGRAALCAMLAIILSLVLCAAAALLIQSDSVPVAFGPYAAQISLAIGTIIASVLVIGRRGEGSAVKSAIAGAVSAILLLLLKLALFPSEQINLMRTFLAITIGCLTAWFIVQPRKKRRTSAKKGVARRK